jgi:membrane associated rhomboid family serine protease
MLGGKLVEEEGGSFAVCLSYLITGAGANLVSWLILPRTVVSAGASGAVFGLFAISVLVKVSLCVLSVPPVSLLTREAASGQNNCIIFSCERMANIPFRVFVL